MPTRLELIARAESALKECLELSGSADSEREQRDWIKEARQWFSEIRSLCEPQWESDLVTTLEEFKEWLLVSGRRTAPTEEVGPGAGGGPH